MRLLDQYILKRFLYNFFSSFVILMFIFIFQTIWMFIDDLAGKGLDIIIIGKFLFYFLPNLTEKVLPLTVLLSSILTFGTFAENYEFAAMKASGISLQRSMLSLIVLVSFLGGLTFYFANSVIPAAEQKIYNLRKNIASLKPAAVIEEGVFSDFEGRNIKVDRKYGENDRYLENVVIHMKSNLQKNVTVIKAKGGELISEEGSEIIQLVLNDGHYYEEVQSTSPDTQKKYPFAKAAFDTYVMNIEIPDNIQDLEADRNVETDKMKNISRLLIDIDSIRDNNERIVTAFSKNITTRMGAFPVNTTDTATVQNQPENIQKIIDKKNEAYTGTQVLELFDNWQKGRILTSAKTSVRNIMNSIGGKRQEIENRYKIYNMHILSLHKKFALALSCIILFFVGAPLGAIIRKGGIGLPMVVAIVLFLAYYFFGVFSGNFAKEGSIPPWLGAWLPTMVMLPLSIFLTRRATADRGLMNFGHFISVIAAKFKRKKEDETE